MRVYSFTLPRFSFNVTGSADNRRHFKTARKQIQCIRFHTLQHKYISAMELPRHSTISAVLFSIFHSLKNTQSGSTHVITDFISKCVLKTQHIEYFDTQNTHTHTHTYIYIEWPINRWYQMQYCNKINDNYVRIMGAHSIRSCVRVPFLQASQTVQYNRGVKTTASEEIQFVPRGHSIL